MSGVGSVDRFLIPVSSRSEIMPHLSRKSAVYLGCGFRLNVFVHLQRNAVAFTAGHSPATSLTFFTSEGSKNFYVARAFQICALLGLILTCSLAVVEMSLTPYGRNLIS